jgi:hypothetical protein
MKGRQAVGWREVADTALTFIRRFVDARPRTGAAMSGATGG